MDKCLEFHEWHDKQFKVLLRQQEAILMTWEDVMAREAHLADHKASLDTGEQEISLQEGKLKATLHAKDDDMEALCAKAPRI